MHSLKEFLSDLTIMDLLGKQNGPRRSVTADGFRLFILLLKTVRLKTICFLATFLSTYRKSSIR
jgi:hypothetical protein